MKILFVSLGCDKNLVDSEYMIGILAEAGHTFTNEEQEAEAIVINSCCFINDAKEESINTILEMAEYKDHGSCKALIVTGCLAQRYKDEIITEIPQVDAVLGTNSYEEVAKALDEVQKGVRFEKYLALEGLPAHGMRRTLTTGGHYAHLKIAEGCDKHCTYCIIPKIRGNYRSIPMEELVAQAESLAEQGVRELILVAQETTLYGIDLYGEKSLHVLLDKLNDIPGIFWIRVMYCYPEEIYEGLISSMKRNKKVCHYLDMPIQHVNDAILKRMGRRTSKAELTEKISRLRSEIPDITLRTTLITGFPGETQEEFEATKEFLRKTGFYEMHIFKYSRRKGTPAAAMKDQISEDIKALRSNELLQLEKEAFLHKTVEVLFEEKKVVEGRNCQIGYTKEYIRAAFETNENLSGQVHSGKLTKLSDSDILLFKP